MRTLLQAAVLVVLFAGCGGSLDSSGSGLAGSAGSGPSEGGHSEDNTGSFGSSCSYTGVKCNVPLICVTMAPDGLCTQLCTSDADCSSYSAKCALAFGAAYCVKTCMSDQMCRDGYACYQGLCLQGTSSDT
jgi:hypothetical protein